MSSCMWGVVCYTPPRLRIPPPYIVVYLVEKGVQSPKQSIWMKKYLWNFFGKLEIYPHYKKKNFWVKKVKWSYISENMKKKF